MPNHKPLTKAEKLKKWREDLQKASKTPISEAEIEEAKRDVSTVSPEARLTTFDE